MNNIFKLFSVLLLLILSCEYPSGFHRDNSYDPLGNNYIPYPPFNVKADFYDYKIFRISWEDSSLGEISFLVERQINQNNYESIATVPKNVNFILDTSVISGAYTYKISSVSKYAKSESVISNTLYDTVETNENWILGPTMNYATRGHKAVSLNDGRILILHSESTTNNNEIYDPYQRKWDITTKSNSKPVHETLLLSDGRVLVFKGSNAFEIFNPEAENWYKIERDIPLNIQEYGARLTLLNDGNVLVTGVYEYFDRENRCCEILEMEVEKFKFTSKMSNSILGHTAVLLADGNVLLAGGYLFNDNKNTKYAEIFNPQEETWMMIDSMAIARNFHGSIVLDDDRVFIVDGDAEGSWLLNNTCEIFDYLSNTWYDAASLNHDFIFSTLLKKLTDGKVFTITSPHGVKPQEFYVEIYNPDIDEWKVTSRIPINYISAEPCTISELPDGNVLITGYNSKQTLIYRYKN